MNHPPKFSSAFSPVAPKPSTPSMDSVHQKQVPEIPVFTNIPNKHNHHRSSRNKPSGMEEYDLDTNFPDVVPGPSPRDFLIEEYRVPGTGPNGVMTGNKMDGYHYEQAGWEEEERVKLLRLVTMQNERIKMQDSQLDIIDTGMSQLHSYCSKTIMNNTDMLA